MLKFIWGFLGSVCAIVGLIVILNWIGIDILQITIDFFRGLI